MQKLHDLDISTLESTDSNETAPPFVDDAATAQECLGSSFPPDKSAQNSTRSGKFIKIPRFAVLKVLRGRQAS